MSLVLTESNTNRLAVLQQMLVFSPALMSVTAQLATFGKSHTPSLHGHRDVAAVLSLARAGLPALLGLARPAYLSRAHAEEPDAHPVPRYPTHPDLAQASSALFSHHAPSNDSAQPSSSSSARHPNSSTREKGDTV